MAMSSSKVWVPYKWQRSLSSRAMAVVKEFLCLCSKIFISLEFPKWPMVAAKAAMEGLTPLFQAVTDMLKC